MILFHKPLNLLAIFKEAENSFLIILYVLNKWFSEIEERLY
jgi:hypothetical protein